MRIKRFAAKDLPSVVGLIKAEFGLAAVILSQRENSETGEVEVTAGVREEDINPVAPASPPPRASSAPPQPPSGQEGRENQTNQTGQAGPGPGGPSPGRDPGEYPGDADIPDSGAASGGGTSGSAPYGSGGTASGSGVAASGAGDAASGTGSAAYGAGDAASGSAAYGTGSGTASVQPEGSGQGPALGPRPLGRPATGPAAAAGMYMRSGGGQAGGGQAPVSGPGGDGQGPEAGPKAGAGPGSGPGTGLPGTGGAADGAASGGARESAASLAEGGRGLSGEGGPRQGDASGGRDFSEVLDDESPIPLTEVVSGPHPEDAGDAWAGLRRGSSGTAGSSGSSGPSGYSGSPGSPGSSGVSGALGPYASSGASGHGGPASGHGGPAPGHAGAVSGPAGSASGPAGGSRPGGAGEGQGKTGPALGDSRSGAGQGPSQKRPAGAGSGQGGVSISARAQGRAASGGGSVPGSGAGAGSRAGGTGAGAGPAAAPGTGSASGRAGQGGRGQAPATGRGGAASGPGGDFAVLESVGQGTHTLPARDLKPARMRPRTAPAQGAMLYRDSEARGMGAFSVERGISEMRSDLGDRLGELKELLLDLAHRQSLAEKWRDRGELVALYRRLLDTGLAPAYAREFVEAAAESLAAWGGDLGDQLRKTVRPFIRTVPPDRAGARILAFTGPTGGGKTASLMKVAALMKQKGRKCAIISLDTLKLGAAEELLQFARIMGVGLKFCQSRTEFAEARELFEGADRILVDTSTRDFFPGPSGKDLPGALAESGSANLLVLPATHKSQDLAHAWKAAAGPFLMGAVLTKLDETVSLGGVINFARSVGPVFAYFSKGYKSPGDFAPADPEALMDLWLAAPPAGGPGQGQDPPG